MASPSLKEKLDKIRSPNLQSQKQVSFVVYLLLFSHLNFMHSSSAAIIDN